MKNKLETVPFVDTPEKHAAMDAIIAQWKDVPGALVQVLEKVQDVYGYLPLEVQQFVAEGMNAPLEEVYGIVTFYSFFSIYPKGQHTISVCMGTACYVKGAGEILDRLQSVLNVEPGQCTKDGRFSLDACRCVGACGLAPVVTIDGEVYGRMEADRVDEILAKYRD